MLKIPWRWQSFAMGNVYSYPTIVGNRSAEWIASICCQRLSQGKNNNKTNKQKLKFPIGEIPKRAIYTVPNANEKATKIAIKLDVFTENIICVRNTS